MVEIILSNDKLILERIENGFKKDFLEFPLENIAGAMPDSILAQNWLRKLNFLAAYIPNTNKPGIQYTDGDCLFWGVNDGDKAIVIFLENEFHNKMVVGVKNPSETVNQIEAALNEKYRNFAPEIQIEVPEESEKPENSSSV